jgi:deoxyribodipyrimidine photo-lyase
MSGATILWFRQDLRLSDHEALAWAIERGGPVVPVYAWAPDEEGAWPPGTASRWWLHRSLEALDASLRMRGLRLILRRGPSLDALRGVAAETGASAVAWQRRCEPAARARDARVAAALRKDGIEAQEFDGALLFEPEHVRTRDGGAFKVFTPFWRACLAGPRIPDPLASPAAIAAPATWPASLAVEDLGLSSDAARSGGYEAAWTPGESGAGGALRRFLDEAHEDYEARRDLPVEPATSRLSPHLHFGEISPRQAWVATLRARRGKASAEDPWLRQLVWREFSQHLLMDFESLPEEPLRAEFAAFPWREDPAGLRAWQQGRTGYPIVDAGMRELAATGWMNNRMRMIVASFLVKDLMLPWQEGERWFWESLVDADLGNNAASWQWVAGCGADASPYFRIFNPAKQGEKFDPGGAYVRRWVPEVAALEDRWLHAPWTAPASALAAAGIELGRTYPEPIVDHALARQAALEALSEARRGG